MGLWIHVVGNLLDDPWLGRSAPADVQTSRRTSHHLRKAPVYRRFRGDGQWNAESQMTCGGSGTRVPARAADPAWPRIIQPESTVGRALLRSSPARTMAVEIA